MLNAYYILKDNEKVGPFTHEELFENGIDPDTFVLSPIAEDWQHAADLPELQTWFERIGVYIPGPTNIASFWLRLLAYIIDYILLVIVLAAVGLMIGIIAELTGNSDIDFESAEYNLLFKLGTIILMLIYNASFEAMPTQGSIGKIICKLAVVDVQGKRLTFAGALGRNAAKWLSSMVCGLGFLSVLWDNERRSWHDHLAKAYVIQKKY